MPDDKKKVCVVTGGGSGLGRVIAQRLAERCNVAIGDVDLKGAEETARLIHAQGGTCIVRQTDVSRSEDVRALVEETVNVFGGLDYAVNNAAIEGKRAVLSDYDEAEWMRVVSINLTGVFLCMRQEIPKLLARGGGSIVNVGSTSSLRGVPLMSAYVAAKTALIGLTKTAALEVADKKVRINIVCPGSLRTPMSERLHGENLDSSLARRTPMRRGGELDEIAAPILWLCSEASTFVTGSVITVDGGKTAGDLFQTS
jgi:NAD(P)-dependent dehydrogenase (short-subunit alcohol dehydrogenase family)